ncbi:cilia- and flagella-associated protein 157 [Adelges cooleyi]|uniref:cilia- and flagella-associated protein 157 n=1 Tax=Adelges cooleyi TaxID=133065 RepID=UPI00217F7DEF|nr:cilia- and flagella-associated protein 157 [Adelges cooleyi]
MHKLKKKTKKKKKNDDKDAALQEVDRAMYNVQIADLTEKLTRVTNRCTELEQNSESDRDKANALKESQCDIIAYLSRQVEMKNNEIFDMDNTISTLKTTIEHQKTNYEDIIEKKNSRFEIVFGQLTAEIGLLKSKVNSLNEFKKQRSQLMEKFLRQEQELCELKKEKDNLIYDTDKKLIIVKEHMKRQNEAKLSELSTSIQSNLQKLMTSTFERTLKENAVINTELTECTERWLMINRKYDLVKSENFDLKMENKIYMKENSRLNNIVIAQKLTMDTLKVHELGLNWKLQNLCARNHSDRRTTIKAKIVRYIAAINKMKKKLTGKSRKIRDLINNLTAMKSELKTLSMHIYKMDSMFVTITASIERKLKENQYNKEEIDKNDGVYFKFLQHLFDLFVATKLRKVEIQGFDSVDAVKVSLLNLNNSPKTPTYCVSTFRKFNRGMKKKVLPLI